jgi:hypothetical protein
MKNKMQIIFTATTSVFMLMFAFEFTKEQIFDGGLAPWESHWITIIFSTLSSLIVSLFLVQSLLIVEKREATLSLKEEKLKSIKMVMSVVFHHVNNLANNLSIISLEIDEFNHVQPSTITELNQNVRNTANEMNRLYHISDPLDTNEFKICFK